MRSTFSGLELGQRTLAAQQLALDITGHNISNAGTQGYSRQIANLATTIPNTILARGRNLSVGSGVTLDSITRARNAYVDRQFRWETSKQQYWTETQNSLQKVEGLMNEPADNSLHDDLDKFWVAWSDLSKNPENLGAKSVVLERAQTLTDSFHRISQQITDMGNDQESNVNVQVTQINDYASRIKDLNDQIKSAEVAGDIPNDFYDARDQLVDELSKIVSVRVTETLDSNFTDRKVGIFKVEIGNEGLSQTLVDDSQASHLQGDGSATNPLQLIDSAGVTSPFDPGTNMGTLTADIEMRDTYLPNLLSKFDSLAQGIVTAVNALHTTYITQNFFDTTGLTAANISMDSTISENIIQTGAVGESGDGSIGSAISSLASGWTALAGFASPLDSATMKTNYGSSFGDYYGAAIAKLGVDVQRAERMTQGEDILVTQLANQKESVSGVSLDEEMTNLIKFQKNYSAAARMVTMMDDMLDKIVNGMGITR